jgi:hypothetical protein
MPPHAGLSGPSNRKFSRAGGLVRAGLHIGAALVLALSVYLGLIQLGVVRSPLAPSAGGDIALARSEQAGLRVLFVGNSFTSTNSMPALVHQLAAGDHGAQAIFAAQYAAPGWSLQNASRDDGLTALLHDVRWNVVVLQEQSQIPSFSPYERDREMLPFAHELVDDIRASVARPMLFMTWGYEDGDQENVPEDTFTAMQARLAEGYSDLAAEMSVPVAPVGLAWAEALRRDPELELWESDGKHPSRLGSYLTACVFYGILSGRDPTQSGFTAGLDEADARSLQRVASDVVHG